LKLLRKVFQFLFKNKTKYGSIHKTTDKKKIKKIKANIKRKTRKWKWRRKNPVVKSFLVQMSKRMGNRRKKSFPALLHASVPECTLNGPFSSIRTLRHKLIQGPNQGPYRM
jgi:hypothetical protein